MIQRQQSLWLLLSAVCSFFSFKFPFYTGLLKDGITTSVPQAGVYAELEGGSNFFLLVLTGISIILSLITIFLYKDRKLQLKLAIGGAILSIIILVIYFYGMSSFISGRLSLSCIFPFAVILGYIMAARGIWKDEKLVKSLDKLR